MVVAQYPYLADNGLLGLIPSIVKYTNIVIHTLSPQYLGGGSRRIISSKPAYDNETLYQTKKIIRESNRILSVYGSRDSKCSLVEVTERI